MYDPWSAAWMMVAWSHRYLASLRTDTVCPAKTAGPFVGTLDGHGLMHSGRHAGLDGHTQQWHVGQFGGYAGALLCAGCAGKTSHQMSTHVHP